MSSMIKQLDSDEAIVLMYLADELPPRDRALVEQRLSAEPALRALLEETQTTQDLVNDRLADADRHDRIGAPTRTQRMLRAEVLRRQVVPAAERNERRVRWRLPAWAYPPAVAALLFVGFMIWWDHNRTNNEPAPRAPVALDPGADSTLSPGTAPGEEPASLVQRQDRPSSPATGEMEQMSDDQFLVQSLETTFLFDVYQDSLDSEYEIALDQHGDQSSSEGERLW